MNANEILDMIGDAKGTYLWETQKYRDGTAGAKHLPRLWLVAAVIGLMLLLVGCMVAYVLRLQDLKVARVPPHHAHRLRRKRGRHFLADHRPANPDHAARRQSGGAGGMEQLLPGL